jgi:hypothetical protein
MTSTSAPDTAQLCPLCGLSNQCTMADPRTVGRACWCFSEIIDPARLQALPAELRNRACLCPRCAGIVEANAHQADRQMP